MGWIHISPRKDKNGDPIPETNPLVLALNAEAQRLDPLTRPDHKRDLFEQEDDWTQSDPKPGEPSNV